MLGLLLLGTDLRCIVKGLRRVTKQQNYCITTHLIISFYNKAVLTVLIFHSTASILCSDRLYYVWDGSGVRRRGKVLAR